MKAQTAWEKRWGVTKHELDEAGQERLGKALEDYAQSYRDDARRPVPPPLCICPCCFVLD